MKKEIKIKKLDNLALEIAARMGSMHHPDNFAHSLIATAEFYKEMKGVDLGIADLKDIKRRIENKNKPWYKRIFNT